MIGVAELPSHITNAVALTIVTPRHVASSLSPHVFLIALGNNGEVILLDGCVTFSDSWQWCVLHAFNPFSGAPSSSTSSLRTGTRTPGGELQLEPHVYADPSCPPSSLSRMGTARNAASYCLTSCSIEMESSHYAVIEDEGSIRLYDWNAFMDKHIVEAEMSDQGGTRRARAGDAWFQQCQWLSSRGQRVVPSSSGQCWCHAPACCALACSRISMH
jgi:hypothetical protein